MKSLVISETLTVVVLPLFTGLFWFPGSNYSQNDSSLLRSTRYLRLPCDYDSCDYDGYYDPGLGLEFDFGDCTQDFGGHA